MVLRRTLNTLAVNLGRGRTFVAYLACVCAVVGLTAFAGTQAIGLLGEAVQRIAATEEAPVADARVLDSFAAESFIYRGPPSRSAREQKAAAPATASKPAYAAKPKAFAATPFAGWFIGAAPPTPLDASEADSEQESERDSRSVATYRTVCVRLCDGYFFPISYATTPDYFAKDSAKCEASCGSPARLYVYENPGSEGGEAEAMEDLEGRPYGELKTAFLYRTEYVPSCSCKAQPWEQEAQDRHRLYALADTEKKVWSDMSKSLGEMRKAKQASKQAVAQLKAEANAESTALKTEMKGLEEKIAEQQASREQAAVAVVAAKGIDVSSGKKKRFAAKRSRKAKSSSTTIATAPAGVLGEGAVQGIAAPAAPAPVAAAPPAKWSQPMALGGAKPKSKIWGNGPNAHAAPRGTGAGDEFRRNFY